MYKSVILTVAGTEEQDAEGIHGAKRWGNLHNEALRNIYSSSNIIRMIK
jgi:hypothetical protein